MSVGEWSYENLLDDNAMYCRRVALLEAENQRLREQIAGFPHVADLRTAMVVTANENQRLRELIEKLRIEASHYRAVTTVHKPMIIEAMLALLQEDK